MNVMNVRADWGMRTESDSRGEVRIRQSASTVREHPGESLRLWEGTIKYNNYDNYATSRSSQSFNIHEILTQKTVLFPGKSDDLQDLQEKSPGRFEVVERKHIFDMLGQPWTENAKFRKAPRGDTRPTGTVALPIDGKRNRAGWRIAKPRYDGREAQLCEPEELYRAQLKRRDFCRGQRAIIPWGLPVFGKEGAGAFASRKKCVSDVTNIFFTPLGRD